ncbi:hypothetical protein QVD17_35354 [Tagetes erecta]|uniref:Uncharacterized protein n=1 Tax=Tagetes erecta TaxID=13708 RepID=A0AAD8K0P7_TARER|nr:hypothetical protein QVD17_35354 [Tagetes erecta]
MSSNNLHPRANTKRQKVLTGSSSKDKRLLGSLKILDLSICEQLQYVGGFSELPALERQTSQITYINSNTDVLSIWYIQHIL